MLPAAIVQVGEGQGAARNEPVREQANAAHDLHAHLWVWEGVAGAQGAGQGKSETKAR